MENETAIIILSALLAGLSFIGFALPFVTRTEKRDKAKKLIQNRRKELYEDTINAQKADASANMKGSVAAFFKAERLIGKAATKIRKQLVNAGYRSHTAPVTYMMIKIILPVAFSLLAIMFLSKAEEMSESVKLLIIGAAVALGWFLPGLMIKNQITKRQEEINLVFPDALDMMLICVQGGISIEQAIARIADEIADQSKILSEELALLSAELGLLADRKRAFGDFAERVGGGTAKSFGTAMVQAEKYGTSISQAIRVMADEQREIRMSNAEQKAASLPPKLTVPMILFFLPPLFVAILGPAFIQINS